MTASRSYAFGAFRLDAGEKVLFQQDRPVPLTPKAVETLLALVERPGRLVTKEELLRIVWPDTFVEENNLAQHISLLRRVLGEDPGGRELIETVPKRGYRFVGPVEERDGTAEAAMVRAPPARARGWPVRALVLGVVAAMALGVVVARSRRGPRRATVPPAGADAVIRVAVLPFANLGSEQDAYFAAGMTEEVTAR